MRKTCLLSVIVVLVLLIVVSNTYDVSVFALKKYGYKEGDEYRFVMEMSSSADSEEGKTVSTGSYEIVVKIKSVDEDVDGYSIKITMLVVSSGYGYFPGMYSYSGPISEQTIEGDRLSSGGNFPSMFNLFTSTDWDDRQDEWDDMVDDIDDQKGYRVTDDSASNGVFTLYAEMDVSDDDSYIDYDGDGDKDGYTGWLSVRGEYDGNGVLKSSTAEMYMEFNKYNRVTYSYKVYRGGKPLLSSETFLYIGAGIAVFVVAFVSGLFVAKHRRLPEAIETPIARSGVATKHCIHCGAEIPEDATFCTKCGRKQEENSSEDSKKRRTSNE